MRLVEEEHKSPTCLLVGVDSTTEAAGISLIMLPSLHFRLALWATCLSGEAYSVRSPGPQHGVHIQSPKSSYDYVIVGGGTSGLTVADRLSADGKSTVLVIENGQIVDSPRISQVYSGVAAMGPTWSYQINSARQLNLNNRSATVVVGKLVGGSSAINAMMTVRGTSDDYDRWGGFFGKGSSWSWEGLLPYFKKAVNFSPPDAAVAKSVNITWDASYWGNSSSVHTSWPRFQWPALATQFEAFRDIPGVEFPPDSGSGKAGVYWFPTFMDPERVERSYARTGHFDTINRANFELITESKVTKILLDDGAATGVSFEQRLGNNTTAITVKANKEVIIAAGAIHSPQLLQQSGIGPSALLEAAGIDTVVDLPGVGQNFQDHPMIFTNIILQNFSVHPNPTDMYSNRNFSAWAQEVWSANKTGPYSLGVGNVAAWLGMPVIAPDTFEEIASKLEKLDHASFLPNKTHPTVVAGYKAQMKDMAAAIRSPNTAFYNHVLTGGASSGTIVDLHPLSRGTVNINTADPFGSEPVVDYRALTNPVDLDIMVEIIRFTKRYYFETRLRDLAPRQVQPPTSVDEPEELKKFLRQNVNPSYFHPVGTCAMMPRELGGVVDERLKVYGVRNLRVVDASIMPVLVGANTCQTTYAIAEKAADLIKADA
ncbi:GMC oxidoreductase [Nemania serpens]|nr:GMC oxidoreductase [Nemania serpens]